MCYFHTEPFDAQMQQTLQDCAYVIGTAVYNAALFCQMLVGKERFEAIFAYTIDGFLLLDEMGTTVLDANWAFYHLTKISPADCGTIPARDLIWSEPVSKSPNKCPPYSSWMVRKSAG